MLLVPVPVSGSWQPRPSGRPATGDVTFTLTATITDGATTIGPAQPIRGEVIGGVLCDPYTQAPGLDVWAVDYLANGDPLPVEGVSYAVVETINGTKSPPYYIAVPASAADAGIDLAATVRQSPTTPIYTFLGGVTIVGAPTATGQTLVITAGPPWVAEWQTPT